MLFAFPFVRKLPAKASTRKQNDDDACGRNAAGEGYSDRLPGVRPVIDGIDSSGGSLSAVNESPKNTIDEITSAKPTSQASGKMGIAGLNATNVATKPTAQ